ncbi:MAG: replication initiation negative regulator SeqA [Puniceicoccales bacterium]|jgi:negative regulator of replication initiation|nr:replication initiation negative regulator SeqA [Puniceicoccales bacterium]
MNKPFPTISPDVYCRLCEHAISNLMLPEDAVRVAVGLKPIEPFTIDKSVIDGHNDIRRFLKILEELYKKGKKQFEETAPQIKGTKRTYFGKNPESIFQTGQSNTPKKIPGSDWYVSSNNDPSRKEKIIHDLMIKMKFSFNYAGMISQLCNSSNKPKLPYKYHSLYIKLKKEIAQSN